MSDDAMYADVFVLRGWARTWDGIAQHLSTEQGELATRLELLQLEFMSSAVTAIDRAAGELSRSGTYTTRVANAIEQADGNVDAVDVERLDRLAFGPDVDEHGRPRAQGGALSDAGDVASSRFINRPEHDPIAPMAVPAPQPNSTGTPPEVAPPITIPSTQPRPTESGPVLLEASTSPPDWSPAVTPDRREAWASSDVLAARRGTDWTDALSSDAPVLVARVPDATAAPEGVLSFGDDGIIAGVLPGEHGRSIPFGEDGIIAGVLPDRPDALSPVAPVLVARVPDATAAPEGVLSFGDDGVIAGVLPGQPERSIPFGEDGIIAGVLPDRPDALSPVAPVLVARVPDATAAPEGVLSFGDDGVIAGVLPGQPERSIPFDEDGIVAGVLPDTPAFDHTPRKRPVEDWVARVR